MFSWRFTASGAATTMQTKSPGARQLAREVSSKVIEKLSATLPQQTVAEKQ